MSYIEPPTLTNIRKRKRSARSASVASSVVSSHLPRDAIDPHSYGPSARRQLVVAGLSHSDRLPSDYVEGFPHRGLPDDILNDGGGNGDDVADTAKARRDRRGSFGSGFGPAFGIAGNDDDEGDDDIDTDSDDDNMNNDNESVYDMSEDERHISDRGDPSENAARLAVKQRRLRRREARRRRNALKSQRAFDQNVGVLATIVQRGLQEAEHGTIPGVSGTSTAPIGLARAKRAFGLIVRTEIKGYTVDLRKNYLRRWGSAKNIQRVRAFYEDLIQQHPYNRLFPRSINALTFWPAMAGTELYNIHAEVQLAMERLDENERRRKAGEAGEDGSDEEHFDDYDNHETHDDHTDHTDHNDHNDHDVDTDHARFRHQRNHPIRLAREDVRLAALEQLRDLARRMDAVMAGPPYATSPEMLRLRGMIALYMGDLAIVTPPRTQPETQEGERVRAQEKSRARARFARLLDVDRDVQSGRQHKRGGIPDTVVDEYIQKLARGRSDEAHNHGSSSEEEDDSMDMSMARPTFTSLPYRSQ